MYEIILLPLIILCVVTLIYYKKEIMKYKNPSIVQQEYRRQQGMKIVKDVSYDRINVTQLKEILTDLEKKGFGEEKVYTWQGGMFEWRTVNERYRAYKDEVEHEDGVYFE